MQWLCFNVRDFWGDLPMYWVACDPNTMKLRNWRWLQGAGAVWDIWQRKSLHTLRAFMLETLHLMRDGRGNPVCLEAWEDPVHSQQCMLSDDLRKLLWHRHRIQAWHFEQHIGEAVFIPAGCAHQVRCWTANTFSKLNRMFVEHLYPCNCICMISCEVISGWPNRCNVNAGNHTVHVRVTILIKD